MKREIAIISVFSCLLFLFTALPALSSELMIYPAKGQSNEQMEQDKFACYQWAKDQSHFDPMAPPTASQAPPQDQAKKGGVVRGAAAGAAVGLTTGAIMNNSKGRSTAAGAAAGALIGGMRRQSQVAEQKEAQKQWEAQEAQTYTQNRDNYNRAYSACLEGRGYTVK